MRNVLKSNKGFSLIELIVVIVVLALLIAGSVLAFNGVQRNARRSAVISDANALASILNNFNVHEPVGSQIGGNPPATAPSDLASGNPTIFNMINTFGPSTVTPTSITLTVPARGVRGAIPMTVHFESETRRNQAIGVLTVQENHFTVDETAVRNHIN